MSQSAHFVFACSGQYAPYLSLLGSSHLWGVPFRPAHLRWSLVDWADGCASRAQGIKYSHFLSHPVSDGVAALFIFYFEH